ncbi:MAG: TrkA family potassium uptake protein [Deltaproteobacteria bacterium]|nr:TrkA family potassium uptake protein [Deltaproteobacteria bacterium]
MRRVVVVGLGIFGFNIAKDLYESGMEVIAIEAILADATDKALLETIGIQEDDIVIISFGEDLAASTLITLHLKELKIKTIIVKAPNEDHKRILEKVGATEVIIPEKEMASKVAKSLISPNVLDYLPLTRDYTICEIAPPPSFVGKTIGDIQLRKKHHIGVIAIRDVLTDQVQMIPSADFMIKDSDILVVIGKEEDIRKLT